jgi:hypothetical protein
LRCEYACAGIALAATGVAAVAVVGYEVQSDDSLIIRPTRLFEVRQIRTRRFLVQAQPEFRHDGQQVIEDV